MKNLYNNVINNRLLYVLLALFGILYLISLYHRYIEDDECILGEYSYYFLHEGVVRVKTMPEILTWDVRLYAHHKFFTWSGALLIKIFGWSIYALKTSTLLWYGLFFMFLYKYFRLLNIEMRKLHFLIAAFIIFTAPIILIKSFSYRPDVLLMMIGMAVIYFIKKYRVKGGIYSVVIAGMLAGLGFLSHLNGIAFCVTGFFLLLILKEFKALWIFTLSGAVIGAFYFLDLLAPGNFQGFIYELMNWPTVNHGENYTGDGGIISIIMGRVMKLLSEHQRFFWGDKVIAFSTLFIIGLALNFKRLKAMDKEIVFYILLLIPALNIFGSHVAERYILFYYGPMAIITALWLVDLRQRKAAAQKAIAMAIVALHITFSVKMLFTIYCKNYNAPELHESILSALGQDAKILAPYAFIYNGLPEYDLYAYKTYEYLQEDIDHPMTQLEVFTIADRLGMDYIIIDEKMREDNSLEWVNGGDINENPYYKIEKVLHDHLILKGKD